MRKTTLNYMPMTLSVNILIPNTSHFELMEWNIKLLNNQNRVNSFFCIKFYFKRSLKEKDEWT